MQICNFLRLSFILSNNQSKTFKKNLLKIIEIILFDNYGNLLTIHEINQKILESFTLEFSDDEIHKSIYSDNFKTIALINMNSDKIYNKYTITPEEYQKILLKEKKLLKDYIVKYLTIVEKIPEYSEDECEDILLRFFYSTFNTDVKTVLALMNYKHEDGNISYCVSTEFSIQEANFINNFLNWQDKDKNIYICNLISCGYDYCMLTVKKDNSSFSNIFNAKVFYLDSNIIFRLVGFNKIERQEVMQSFIKKCIDAGIILKYTNHTNDEIKSTIKYYVSKLEKTLKGQQPISMEAMQAMSSKYANLDFYERYVNWTRSPHNIPGDFKSFQHYLEKEISDCISLYKFDSFNSFESKKKDNGFNDYCEEFKSYKESHYRDTYEGAIKVDINNYLHMLDINSKVQANSFWELNNYFITADHCLIGWTQEKRPGAVPVFILPSVWYSILLKYKGRTEKDYAAFCQFLNIRIAINEDPLITTKQAILSYVLSLNETQKIKEQIIFDINSNLENPDEEINDIESYVDSIHTSITKKKIDEALEEVNVIHSHEVEDVKTKVEKDLKIQYDKEIEEGYKYGLKSGQVKGHDEAHKTFITIRTDEIISMHKIIRSIFIIIAIFGGFSLLTILVVKLFNGQLSPETKVYTWINDNSIIVGIISGIVTFIFSALEILSRLWGFISIDNKIVEEKLIKKYKNKEK